MKNREAHALASLYAVQTFLNTYADRVPRTAASGARRRLDELIDQLNAARASQGGETWRALTFTQSQLALRESLLHDHIAPVIALARFIAGDLGGPPELAPFRAPRGEPSAARLCEYALGLANAIEPYADRFIAAGLLPAFVDDMRVAANAVLQAQSTHRLARGSVGGATVSIAEGIRIGRLAVRALSAMARSELRGDPALLQSWHMAARIERLSRGAIPALPAARTQATLAAGEPQRFLASPAATAGYDGTTTGPPTPPATLP